MLIKPGFVFLLTFGAVISQRPKPGRVGRRQQQRWNNPADGRGSGRQAGVNGNRGGNWGQTTPTPPTPPTTTPYAGGSNWVPSTNAVSYAGSGSGSGRGGNWGATTTTTPPPTGRSNNWTRSNVRVVSQEGGVRDGRGGRGGRGGGRGRGVGGGGGGGGDRGGWSNQSGEGGAQGAWEPAYGYSGGQSTSGFGYGGGGGFPAGGGGIMFQWPSAGNWYYATGPIKIGYRVCPRLVQRVSECGKGPMTPCPHVCKRWPAAKCIVNPCGGCFAEWYLGQRRVVDCD